MNYLYHNNIETIAYCAGHKGDESKRFENTGSILLKLNKKDFAKFFNVIHPLIQENVLVEIKIYSDVHQSPTISFAKFYTNELSAQKLFENILLSLQNFKEEPNTNIFKFTKHCLNKRFLTRASTKWYF